MLKRLSEMAPTAIINQNNDKSIGNSINTNSLSSLYTLVSLKRNTRHNVVCIALTAPLIVLGTFCSAYVSLFVPPADNGANEIVLYREAGSNSALNIDEFNALLKSVEGIKGFSYFIYRTDYMMSPVNKNIDLITSVLDEKGIECTNAEFGVASEDLLHNAGCSPEDLEGDNCVVPIHPNLVVGDIINLITPDKTIPLKIAGMYNTNINIKTKVFSRICVARNI